MTVTAFGAEPAHFRVTAGAIYGEYDPQDYLGEPARGFTSHTRSSIAWLDSKDAAGVAMPLARGWFHTCSRVQAIQDRLRYVFAFCDSAGNTLFGLRVPAAGTYYSLAIGPENAPTAEVTTTIQSAVNGALRTLDFYFEVGVAGKVDLYEAGVLIATVNGDTSALAACNTL